MNRYLSLLLVGAICYTSAEAGNRFMFPGVYRPVAEKIESKAEVEAKEPAPNIEPQPCPPQTICPPVVPCPECPKPDNEEPSLTLPETIEGDVGSFIKIKSVTNGTHVRWVPVDKGLAVFPGEMLKDSLSTVVSSNVPGQYRMLAYTAKGDLPSDPVFCMVVVRGPQPPPDPKPQPTPTPVPPQPTPQPTPTPTPVVVTSPNLWIVTVDAWEKRTPTISKVLDPHNGFWDQLKSHGHEYRQLNSTDPAVKTFTNQINLNGGLPCVIIMAKTGDPLNEKWLNKDPADMRLPNTVAGMAALIAKYSGR